MFINARVADVIEFTFDNKRKDFWGATPIFKLGKLNKAHTYMCVFGPSQEPQLDIVRKETNVIFEGRKAVNNNRGHTDPRLRNVIVIFEKKE